MNICPIINPYTTKLLIWDVTKSFIERFTILHNIKRKLYGRHTKEYQIGNCCLWILSSFSLKFQRTTLVLLLSAIFASSSCPSRAATRRNEGMRDLVISQVRLVGQNEKYRYQDSGDYSILLIS